MTIAAIFTDGMVLQQGIRVPVWGTANPGVIVTVRFVGQEVFGVADPAGKWMAHLHPVESSSLPASLEIVSSEGENLSLTDVLVGEVWVCSGQSNMEWPVRESNDSAAEITAAEHPQIRLFTVPLRPSSSQREDLGGVRWCRCSPQTVASFSAAGYFFGLELHRKLQVPIGLINSSVGGTYAESWTSREQLLAQASLRHLVEDLERDITRFERRKPEWVREMAALVERTTDTGNTGHSKGWADLDEPLGGDWLDMTLPGSWQSWGLNHSGILWFRKTVELPVSWEGQDLSVSLGAADKSDTTYFNNEQIGSITMDDRSDAWSLVRTYPVPGRLVKAGRNVIAVRVHSEKFAGGMTGPAQLMEISCPAMGDETVVSLAGAWRYAVEANYGLIRVPEEPLSADHQNAPCSLFNGMIAPLVPFALRGFIWYQGEANADRAQQYQILLPALIRSWRRAWGLGDVPFYFVQLANYLARSAKPSESTWAELREAQRLTLAVPNTGMAVAIDIGEADNIHPRNKQDVGLRLAFNALHQTYGRREVVPCGPLFRSMTREGAFLRLAFDFVADRLVCRGEELRGFALAGENGLFAWATAKIEGDHIVVSHPDIPFPLAVRYAWADNPEVNFYNSAGLPASPFQAIYHR
ncbi:sialate O-acetylesterase [soil metagenome]